MSASRKGFTGDMLLVTVAHGLLIGALLLVPMLRGCDDASSTSTPMELMVDLPDNGTEPDIPPRDATKEPAPRKDEAKPPEPPPDKNDILMPDKDGDPRKTPPPKKKDIRKVDTAPKKIEVSKTLVRRNKAGGSGKSKLTAAEVQRLLDRGAKIGKPTLSDDDLRRLLNSDARFGEGKSMTQEAVYLDAVKQTMYRAWDQPTSLGIAGLVARVEFSFGSDGSISGCRMTAPSGNATMDESVMRAARSVHRINGVPVTFFSSHRRINVAFELTGGD